MSIRCVVYFSGRVQGVGFRFTAERIAAGHDVSGYVQNLPDGRVRLVAEGEAAAVDGFVRDVQTRMAGFVRRTVVDKDEATGEFARAGDGRFTVRY